MIFGNTAAPTGWTTLAADTKRLVRRSLGVGSRVSKLTAFVDGLGSGAGSGPSQVARAVIYDASGNLVATSDEVAVLSNQAAGWVDFSFLGSNPEGILLAPGLYDIGLHAGATSNVIRLWDSRCNLIANPKAAGLSTTGWGNSGLGTFAAVTLGSGGAPAPSAEMAALGLTTGFHATGNSDLDSASNFTSADVGATYTLSAYYWVVTLGGAAQVLHQINDSAVASGVAVTTTGQWLRVSATLTATVNQIGAVIYQIGAGAADWYFTGVVIEQAASAGPYLEPDPSGKTGSDTYVGGASNPIGTTTANVVASSLFATTFLDYEPPSNVDDDYLASLGFQEAQAIFGVDPPLSKSDVPVTVGWYGTKVSPLRGSYAVAQKDGVLTDYVGERVKVTHEERSVLVYVTDERDIDQDLALSRRAFLALAQPSDGEIEAVVEILAADG